MSWVGTGKAGDRTLHRSLAIQSPGPEGEVTGRERRGVLQGQEKVLQGQEGRNGTGEDENIEMEK